MSEQWQDSDGSPAAAFNRRAAMRVAGYAGGMLAAAGAVSVATNSRAAHAAPLTGPGYVNVADPPYSAQANAGATSAVGTDDTPAIQAALTAVGNDGGGIVFLPAGRYKIMGSLSVPEGTALVGVSKAPAYGGTELYAFGGKNNAGGTPLITLNGLGATLESICIRYPEQNTSGTPLQYPWTIRGGSDPEYPYGDLTVRNVELVNPFQGIDFGTNHCGRHLIENVRGQPLHMGIYVNRSLDVGRIKNVHFWPYWSLDMFDYQRDNAISLYVGHSDWQVVDDFFSFGYHAGIMFGDLNGVGTNGQFSNIGIDSCDVGLDVYATQSFGVHFTNLNIAANPTAGSRRALWKHPGQSAHVFIRGGSFWGPLHQVAHWDGSGLISFKDSAMIDWQSPVCVELTGSCRAMIQGCYFREQGRASTAVSSAPMADRVMVNGNMLTGNGLSLSGALVSQTDNL